MGKLISASGVQQGDPLDPLLFALVLNDTITKIAQDPLCGSLQSNFWYLDDGVLSGPRSRAMDIIQGDSTSNDFEILGAPIGSHDFCTAFIERKLKEANQLLSLLPKLCDPQSAIALLRVCASFCRLAHLARSIPPTTASLEAFAKFDDDVLHCLECSVEIELTPRACNQAKLGLKYEGLGLRSLAMHAQAAYIASLSTSLTPIQPSDLTMQRLCDAIMVFNGKVACCEQLSVEHVEDVLATFQHQHKLSSAIGKAGFLSLLDGASTVDKARLLATSAPQAHAWLRAQPSPKLGLDLLPIEVQALVKWWLWLPVFTDADACPHCSQTLDIHGHHALIRHADFCCRACLAPELERGCGLTSTKDRTRPADVLVPNWSLSRSAAFDLKVINPLNSNFLLGASMTSGYTAELGEKDKHSKNDIPCTERGWVCVPLVVEVFGGWGNEAQEALSRVAKKLAIRISRFWPEVLASMYCHLGITLMRQNARALLGRRSTSEVDNCLV
ncbi:hypothetical protein EMCRGX_G022979 [Ephydatia muelleri]